MSRLSGKWYRGNTHIHSTASDGGRTFAELARMYAGVGCDFLFRTDHRVASDVSADTEDYPLLWLDGVELDGMDETGAPYHVVCLGRLVDISNNSIDFVSSLKSAREQGAITILAHPHWTGNTLEDALRHNFDGIEIYNHVCKALNGKGDGLVHWEAMLNRNPHTLAFAADDTHARGWNGGWIMVNCLECTSEAITSAIRGGNFYSSCGPEFHSIECDGSKVSVQTSPIRFARLVGAASRGARAESPNGDMMTEVVFEIPDEWGFAYVEIEDGERRRAWTNCLGR